MADNEKILTAPTDEIQETVDDILAEILNSDGTFNDDFNSLLAKYIGVSQQEIIVPKVDISDRSDENIPRERAVFESADVVVNSEKSIDERIEEKLPEAVREMYAEASSEAQRPEFTSTGDVKYPTMGIGEAEQRVVFDADWEEKARQEAARLERVRQDRMLRGDSTYARTFVAGGMYMAQRNPYYNVPQSNSPYIDPLSRDEDFETADNNSQYYNSNKKPFFPEGFSVIQKNNGTANGKTANSQRGNRAGSARNRQRIDENTYEAFASSYEKAEKARASWLEIEDKTEKKKKKKSLFAKNRKTSDYERPVAAVRGEGAEKISVNTDEGFTEDTPDVRTSPVNIYDTDVMTVADETAGLRSTVQEIVDKYNKRNEEDERKRIEKEARERELRRIEQEMLEKKKEELRILKQDMSPELADIIGEDEDFDDFGDYDDFSSEPESSSVIPLKEEKLFTEAPSSAVISDGADYLERLDDEFGFSDMSEEVSTENEGQKDKSKNSRHKRNGGRKK